MSRWLPRILLVLCLAALGFGLGFFGRRILWRVSPPTPAAERPAALERAWRAMERGQREPFEAALREAESLKLSKAWAAERVLLPLLVSRDRVGVEAFVEAHQDLPAAAAALDWLIATTDSEAERAALRARLARQFPEAWRINSPQSPSVPRSP